MVVDKKFKKISKYFKDEYGIEGVSYQEVKRGPTIKTIFRNELQNLCQSKKIKIPERIIKAERESEFFIHEFLHLNQYKTYDLQFGKGYTVIWCGVEYKLKFNVNSLYYYYKCGDKKINYSIPWEVGLGEHQRLIRKYLKL